MPTTRPRYQITETPEVARALDLAARLWPHESRSRLVIHLIRTGGAALEEAESAAQTERLAAIQSAAGKYADAFSDDHLDQVRQDWPA